MNVHGIFRARIAGADALTTSGRDESDGYRRPSILERYSSEALLGGGWRNRRRQSPRSGLLIGIFALIVGITLPAHSLGSIVPKASTVTDPSGDAVFGNQKYHSSAPAYLDIIQASISLKGPNYLFQVKVNGTIPAVPSLNFSYNHLGAIFGIQTNRSTAVEFGLQQLKEKTKLTAFNWLVGLLYTNGSDGQPIIGLGWQAWLLNASTFAATPLNYTISGSMYNITVGALAIESPVTLKWLVITELDWEGGPEPSGAVEFTDCAPDSGLASWP